MKSQKFRWIITSLLVGLALGMFLWPTNLRNAGGQGREWRVWMKVSPCSASRQEWVSVADQDPTTGAGGPHFIQFPGTTVFPTFAAAMTAASTLRNMPCTFGTGETGTCPKYANYCCANYRVFRNSATGKRTVVAGLYGNPGGGFTEQEGGPMCCEDAAAAAGFPASFCGGGGGGSANTCFANDPGMASTNRDDHYNWAQQQDAARLEANLRNKINLLFNCSSVSDDQLSNAFADFSVVIARYVQDSGCFGGDRGATNTDWSAHKAWATTKSRSQLLRNLQGKTAAAFKCLDRAGQSSFFADSSVVTAKTPLAESNSGSESGETTGPTNTNPPPGVRQCTADEAAAFAQMTGSFHSYRMNITIGGSCEKATGTFKYTEWCEGVDETSNSSLARTLGTFTGRMSGGSLQVAWEAPASPSSGPRKSTGSCSANSDGTFSCSGFPCAFKSQ